MQRAYTITYSCIIAVLSITIGFQILHPPKSRSATVRAQTKRLSALILSGVSREGKVAAAERRIHGLQLQLASLDAWQKSQNPSKEFVEVDQQAFARENRRYLRGFIGVDPTHTKLSDALGLGEGELDELKTLFTDFKQRLHALEASAIEDPDQDRPPRSNELTFSVPEVVPGREKLFDELQTDLDNFLGFGRGAIAMSALRSNDLIGPENSRRNYSFDKNSDGRITFTPIAARNLLLRRGCWVRV